MRQVIVGAALAMLAVVAPARADQRARPPQVSPDGALTIDPVMFDLAVRTGGEFYFWAPGEFARHARAMVATGGKGIAHRYGELPVGGTVEVDVAVPAVPNVGSVRFFAGVQKKAFIALRRPDGRTVTSSDDGIERVETRHMLVVTVPEPQPGVWTLSIAGRGHYQATARTSKRQDNYDDLFFRFVEISGRPGHQGLFPTDGIPAAGSVVICSVTLDLDLEEVSFGFEDADGAVLESVNLVKEEPDPALIEMMTGANTTQSDARFFGDCRVPRSPFRFVARGVDRMGKSYEQRTAVMHPPGGN